MPIPRHHFGRLDPLPEALKSLREPRQRRHQKGFVVLGWHITIGLSVFSLLANFAYFYAVLGGLEQAVKYSASSLLTIGACHAGNALKDKYNK